MDIILQTNTDNPSMAFREITRFGDDSGYSARVILRSNWISADYVFFFENRPLIKFLDGLEKIDRTLSGLARLKPEYEPQFIEFEGMELGHIFVRGELMEHGQHSQRIFFEFQTDQTCLRPFITEFRKIVA